MLFTKRNNFIKMRTALLIVAILIVVLFLFSNSILAATDYGLDEAEGINLGTRPLEEVVVSVVNVALGFLGLLAVIFIIYGGFTWMMAGGNADKVDKARKILIRAVIGLVIILSAYGIASFIFKALGWVTGGEGDYSSSNDSAYYYSGGLASGIIKSHYPARGETGVPRNTLIVITFKEAINIDSITSRDNQIGNITITDEYGSNVIATIETEDNYSFIIDPAVPSDLGNSDGPVVYTVALNSNIEKLNGDSAFTSLSGYDWEFTVSTEFDDTPPQLISALPAEGSVVPRNAVVQMNFNEPINPLSAAGKTSAGFDHITLKKPDLSLVEGEFIINNGYETIEFLTNDLCGINSCGNEVYCLPRSYSLVGEITVDTPVVGFDGVTDMAGNSFDGNKNGVSEAAVADNYNWSFTTSNEMDLTPPELISVTPGVSSNNISTRASVKVIFSELMMFSTLNNSSLMLDRGVNYWVTNSNQAGRTESLIKHDEFTENTTYSPLVTSACQDLYQNCFDSEATKDNLE